MDGTRCDNSSPTIQHNALGPSSTQSQTPRVGERFKTVEEARAYYENFGRRNGFWIRTRTTAKSRTRIDEVTFVKFVCSHEGKYYNRRIVGGSSEAENCDTVGSIKRRSCSTVRGGCKANMRISYDIESGHWIVKAFEDDHNHKFVSPIKRVKMRSNRSMPESAKDLSESFKNENIKVAKVVSILGGDHIGFNERDCYNHLRCIRHKELEVGDAQSVLSYFQKKQAENPQFYYAIQCDEDGRATNFFWVDARSRMSYESFGDVVTFDTTYRTNKYDMPFAPFTGVNHHSQSIQFGCALLQDETEVTFLWLFQTWLDAMGGRNPMCIITDQDPAMKAAIAKSCEGKCECQYFEFAGIICGHILKILVREDIDVLPSHFIKRRWTQGANKFRSTDLENIVTNDGDQSTRALRLGHMCRKATQLACHAAESNEGYQLYIKAIEEVSEKIYRLENGSNSDTPSNDLEIRNEGSSQFVLSDPNVSITKGRKKEDKGKEKDRVGSGRIKSSIELAQKNKKRQCALCKGLGHDKRICPENPKKKSENDLIISNKS